jgi:hypothetical protein
MLLTALPATFAQDTAPIDRVPPRIIDTNPLFGVEIAQSAPLTLIFDQPMDQQSVADALSLTPDIPVSLIWQDARTLAVTPDGGTGWERSTTYALSIDTSAQSAAGAALAAPFTMPVIGIGELLVASIIPEPGASDIDVNTQIVVAFDRPVVALTSTDAQSEQPQPLTFDPPISGSGSWFNTSMYVFTPTEPLPGSTTYTATVNAGLTAFNGSVMSDAYSWTFTTPPPIVTRITPLANSQNTGLDEPVVVTFNQAMDRQSVEAAFSLRDAVTGEPVAGSFAWSGDDEVLTFAPNTRLALETSYVASVSAGALSANGQGRLDSEITATFTTLPYPAVISTSPSDGDVVDPFDFYGFSVRFNTPINPDTIWDKVVITPEVDFDLNVYQYDPVTLQITFTPQPDTFYSITIKAGIEDQYGNATREDSSFGIGILPPQPEAYPLIAGTFNTTGAYRPDTSFAMMVSGELDVSFELYQMPPESISNITFADFIYDDYYAASDTYLFDGGIPPWAFQENLLRSWTQTLGQPGEERVLYDVLLASEDGGQLQPGLYWVTVSLPVPSRQMFGSFFVQFGLAVANVNLTTVRSADETLIWATDMQTAAPLANMTINVYREGDILYTGVTDEQGLYRAPVDLLADGIPQTFATAEQRIRDARIVITAEGEAGYGAMFINNETSLPTERGYLYTDRPIYRPGETVYFRGVLRDRRDMDYSVPDIEQVQITIQEEFGERIYYEGTLDVTPFGTYSGEFVIPEDAPLGEIAIIADFGAGETFQFGAVGTRWNNLESSSVTFSVAEFRVPEFAVSVEASVDEIVQGDSFDALIGAALYAGGAIQDANVNYRVYGDMSRFNYTGTGRYSFSDSAMLSGQDYFYQQSLLEGTDAYSGLSAPTDANGRLLLDVVNTTAPIRVPMEITIEADVTDASGQAVANRTTVFAHPAAAYVGVGTESYIAALDLPKTINLIAVTPDSTPIPNADMRVELFNVIYEQVPTDWGFTWERSLIARASAPVAIDAAGAGVYNFVPTQAGTYLVRAVVTDDAGRENSASIYVYVPGEGAIFVGADGAQSISVVPDQDSYQPGDTASLLLQSPFPADAPATALITVQRADIMYTDLVPLSGTSIVYDLALPEEYAPNVFVSVVAVHGIWQDFNNPGFATGSLRLTVEPTEDRLNINVQPSAEQTAPRESVSFDLTVTDAEGNPAQAEVGVALTDEAVLALAPRNSATLEQMFYGEQNNAVQTRIALSTLIDPLTDAFFPGGRGGGGGGGGGGVLIREDFDYTPLWAPHVVTNADGEATVSVTLPDNLTTWRLDARGVTMNTQVGETTMQIVSTLPLFVRPVAPRFFVVGDRVQLASVIQNNTPSEQNIVARLEATGLTIDGDAEQPMTIPANSSQRVTWMVTVDDVSAVDVTFFAIGDEVQDAAKPALRTADGLIPVYRYTAPDTVGTSGALLEAATAVEGIALPPRYAQLDGMLTVEVSPSLAAAAVDSLDYLRAFPHECIEQTVSRFLPNIITYAALRDLNVSDPALESALDETLAAAVQRLEGVQNADGGWGWFPGMDSDTLVTAYALLGLAEAQFAGFAVDETTLQQADDYLRSQWVTPGLDTQTYRLNRESVLYYAQARYAAARGASEAELLAKLDALFAFRDAMSVAAQSFMLMTYQTLDADSDAVPTLISLLTDSAILSATGAHWEEAANEWINWGSSIRTSAIALSALAQAQPDHPLLPNAVRWLMTARQGDRWQTTQETAWSVMGLTEWMQISGELQADYSYAARLNGDLLREAAVSPETVRDGSAFSVSVSDLRRDDVNALAFTRDGDAGALYYTAFLSLNLPADQVEALSRGVTVERRYFSELTPSTAQSAFVGETIRVRLTITAPQDIFFFVLEDPIPAGTEMVDTSLSTTGTGAQSALFADNEGYFWFYNSWVFDHSELRDQEARLYADHLPRGTYVYTYLIRAAIPGEYAALPAQAYAFYQPDVFGRTDGSSYTIVEAP